MAEDPPTHGGAPQPVGAAPTDADGTAGADPAATATAPEAPCAGANTPAAHTGSAELASGSASEPAQSAAGPARRGTGGAAAGSQPASVTEPVRTRGLSKRYRGGQLAVDGLDLTVPQGSVFGFLGPNGSGKTTTIRMLIGLIEATEGSAELLGAPMPRGARHVLPRVGALIEGPALYGFLSGRDNLLRSDSADPTADPRTRSERVGLALERVGLAAAARKKARAYSLGMKQRLGLAAALLQPRELLVLDEPTNGLDPQGMREIRALIRELAQDGMTVFLSSHLLDEIEQVCSHTAVMHRGRLVTQGTVADMAASAHGRLAVTTPDTADAVRVLSRHGLSSLTAEGDQVTGELPATSGAFDLAALNAALVRADVRVRAFGPQRASLEDVFVELTGEGFNVAD